MSHHEDALSHGALTMREARISRPSYGDFLRGLLDNPRGVSAPTPSSAVLAKTIADEVDVSVPGLVVELGPGTGAVTAGLVARGLAPRLVAVEQDENFVAMVKARFGGVDVRQGDALLFEAYLPPEAEVAAVVSGLPLLNFPLAARKALLARALARVRPGGVFVQLSYSWKPPVPPDGAKLSRRLVLRNFPPACVWTYRAA